MYKYIFTLFFSPVWYNLNHFSNYLLKVSFGRVNLQKEIFFPFSNTLWGIMITHGAERNRNKLSLFKREEMLIYRMRISGCIYIFIY